MTTDLEKERLEQAKEISRRVGRTGVSLLQREMGGGYMTASRLLDVLIAEGFCVRAGQGHVFKISIPSLVAGNNILKRETENEK